MGLAAVLRLKGPEFWKEALSFVNRVLSMRQNQAAAFAEKGRILERMGQRTEAAEAFEKSRLRGTSPGVRLGNAYQQVPPQSHPLTDERPNQEPARLDKEPVTRVPTSGAVPQIVSRISHEQAEPPARLRLKRSMRAARTSEARFYRRWARRGGDPEHGRLPGELRRQAEALLNSILVIHPNDSHALAEKGFLLIESGELQEAQKLLEGALERLPGTPLFLSALARVEREQARAKSLRLSDESKTMVFAAPDRLRRLIGGFEPLIHLQKGRAVLALHDGQVRRDLAAKEFNRLHEWMRPHLEPDLESFEAWWSQRLNEQVFLPLPPDAHVMPEVVEELSLRLDARAVKIDFLDEAYSLRKDPRAVAVA